MQSLFKLDQAWLAVLAAALAVLATTALASAPATGIALQPTQASTATVRAL